MVSRHEKSIIIAKLSVSRFRAGVREILCWMNIVGNFPGYFIRRRDVPRYLLSRRNISMNVDLQVPPYKIVTVEAYPYYW